MLFRSLGLSELTDAVVLVVSEETGQMSIAHDGILEHNLNTQDLKEKLTSMLQRATLKPAEEVSDGELLVTT